jgi:hypothetical protein
VRRLSFTLLVALMGSACGSEPADLFSVERSGAGAGARVRLVVSDAGTVRCNAADPVALGAERLLEARELARQLAEQATLGLELPPGPADATTFTYRAELADGQIAFADSSRALPQSFSDLAGFTRIVSRQVCKLPR